MGIYSEGGATVRNSLPDRSQESSVPLSIVTYGDQTLVVLSNYFKEKKIKNLLD